MYERRRKPVVVPRFLSHWSPPTPHLQLGGYIEIIPRQLATTGYLFVVISPRALSPRTTTDDNNINNNASVFTRVLTQRRRPRRRQYYWIRLFSHKSLPAVAATAEPLPIYVHMVAAVPPFPPVYLCPNLLLYIVVVIIIFNVLFSIRPTFVCTQTPNGE